MKNKNKPNKFYNYIIDILMSILFDEKMIDILWEFLHQDNDTGGEDGDHEEGAKPAKSLEDNLDEEGATQRDECLGWKITLLMGSCNRKTSTTTHRCCEEETIDGAAVGAPKDLCGGRGEDNKVAREGEEDECHPDEEEGATLVIQRQLKGEHEEAGEATDEVDAQPKRSAIDQMSPEEAAGGVEDGRHRADGGQE